MDISSILSQAKRPAVLWSGGKDSTLLLWLARQQFPKIECIQYRLPWLPKKWDFHHYLARKWDLTVHDFSPQWSALCCGNDRTDVMETYEIGKLGLTVARGTEPYTEGEPYVCGLEWLQRPKAGAGLFPFDVLLCGHKSVDIDPLSGPVPLKTDRLKLDGSASIVYPLADWTDEDVTNVTLREGIPWDANRYELSDGVLKTKNDKTLNSDYYNTCLRCVDKNISGLVDCPKWNKQIENVSANVKTYEPSHDYCSLRT